MMFISLPASAFIVRSTEGSGNRCWGPISCGQQLTLDFSVPAQGSLPDESVCRARSPSHMLSCHPVLFLRAHTLIHIDEHVL